MSRIWTSLTKNLLRGVFMGMLVILLLRIGGTSALALAQSCGQWSVVSSPSSGTGSTLTAVTAVSSKNVWAVGYSSVTQPSLTLIEHWNGKKWRLVHSPDNGGQLYGVTAISKQDIWAVGITATGQTLTEHWNGKSWSIVSIPGARDNQLYGVAARSTNDVWAVGDYSLGGKKGFLTLTYHWDGISWSEVSDPKVNNSGFYGVTVTSKDDFWAVGASGTGPGGPPDTLTEFYC